MSNLLSMLTLVCFLAQLLAASSSPPTAQPTLKYTLPPPVAVTTPKVQAFLKPQAFQALKPSLFHPNLLLSALTSPSPSPSPQPPPVTITCASTGCRGQDGRSYICVNLELNTSPQDGTDHALLLYTEFDFTIYKYVAQFRAQVSLAALQSGTNDPVPWISVESQVPQTSCFEVAFFGNPFGTCCRPCSYLHNHIRPPPFSCCYAC